MYKKCAGLFIAAFSPPLRVGENEKTYFFCKLYAPP